MRNRSLNLVEAFLVFFAIDRLNRGDLIANQAVLHNFSSYGV